MSAVDNDEQDFGEYMQNIDTMMKEVMRQSFVQPKNLSEHWTAFSSAINWSEPLLIGLITFNILVFWLILLFRSNTNVQALIFIALCILIRSSEFINSYCSSHWNSIATQNYFDEHGVFASILFAGPLLTCCFTQVVS